MITDKWVGRTAGGAGSVWAGGCWAEAAAGVCVRPPPASGKTVVINCRVSVKSGGKCDMKSISIYQGQYKQKHFVRFIFCCCLNVSFCDPAEKR